MYSLDHIGNGRRILQDVLGFGVAFVGVWMSYIQTL